MQNELTTTNILSLFETSKAQRASFVTDVIERVQLGSIDPIKVHLQVKAMEDIVKQITGSNEYKEILLDAAAKNGVKFSAYNANFQIKEAGVKYDYSHCGDVALLKLQDQSEKLAIEINKRQEFLKKVKPGTQILDDETGELITVYPPIKSSTTTVTVTLL